MENTIDFYITDLKLASHSQAKQKSTIYIITFVILICFDENLEQTLYINIPIDES